MQSLKKNGLFFMELRAFEINSFEKYFVNNILYQGVTGMIKYKGLFAIFNIFF